VGNRLHTHTHATFAAVGKVEDQYWKSTELIDGVLFVAFACHTTGARAL